MIVRFAVFEGTVHAGNAQNFRNAILERVVPRWKAMPNVQTVSVNFEVGRDDGAPQYPMIVAISYPDRDAMEDALASVEREQTKFEADKVMADFFVGTLHHHIMETDS
ncbi:hypothetical protein [Pararhizobium sp. IMCC21322]|uniref:hypothetical protein n=1 Tax=Pararhizobium sp. IMCC21322 TaxID=3067903 RepID=UPI0027426920|nr:hypothetical protein [Pararhizobium sp. IMCC21322]